MISVLAQRPLYCTCCCRFVSDYGPEGYDCVCQHRLLQALQRLNVGPEYVRTYPPCLLEWTANRKRAHTVLHIHCFDGENTHTLHVVKWSRRGFKIIINVELLAKYFFTQHLSFKDVLKSGSYLFIFCCLNDGYKTFWQCFGGCNIIIYY